MKVLVTGTVVDATGRPDNTPWTFNSLVLREGTFGEVITTKRRTVAPSAGALTVKLDPGPCVIEYGGNSYYVEVPEAPTADLWDVIEAAVAYPPDTAQELLAAAVAGLLDENLVSSGEASLPRDLCNSGQAMTDKQLRLRYFTARKTETITKVRTYTGSTAAGATPTLCRVGIYSVDVSGNLTLVASTANDTTLWAAVQTGYQSNLSASWSKTAGQRYAVAALCVSAATVPTIAGQAMATSAFVGRAPRITGFVSAQSDLPSTISAGSVTDTSAGIFVEMIP